MGLDMGYDRIGWDKIGQDMKGYDGKVFDEIKYMMGLDGIG